jgi:PIN domain nuclease of toxin-antitoxin system
MRLLLDTHAFIWLTSRRAEMPSSAWALLRNPDNALLVSIASIWEMGIKSNHGKLTLADPFAQFVRRGFAENNIDLLPISVDHVVRLEQLPRHHKDPFDRMIVAQALEEDIPVIGRDRMLDEYGVDRRW